MACPYREFVSVYKDRCTANRNKDIPNEYKKTYCYVATPKKGFPGYKACPYYKKHGPGF